MLGIGLEQNTKAQIDLQFDLRSYQHGIDFIPLPDGNYYLFWSTTKNPPFRSQGTWPHDIYYSKIDSANPMIEPVLFISEPEAQEPVSAAIAENGRIMISFEDGWDTPNTVAQRYGVYDVDLAPIKPYPQMVFDGGHSGHVVAVGNRFVVFYSDEWVDGGGVDELGTGDDVLVKIYNSDGEEERSLAVAVSEATRDWWPLVAGSKNRAALIWQRYVPDQLYANLMVSILNPETGGLIKPAITLEKKIAYYTYSIEYLPSIDRFLVAGTYQTGGGFAYLLDGAGQVTAANEQLPPIIRESQPVIRAMNEQAMAVQAIAPSGVMVLLLTPDSITLDQTITGDHEWQYIGTDGIFISPEMVYMVSLSDLGLVEKRFSIPKPVRNISEPIAQAADLELPMIWVGGLMTLGLGVFGIFLWRRRA